MRTASINMSADNVDRAPDSAGKKRIENKVHLKYLTKINCIFRDAFFFWSGRRHFRAKFVQTTSEHVSPRALSQDSKSCQYNTSEGLPRDVKLKDGKQVPTTLSRLDVRLESRRGAQVQKS